MFSTSSQERSSETLKMDAHNYLRTTLKMLLSLKGRSWTEHWDNVLSALRLLNAFSDYFDHHSDDMVNNSLHCLCDTQCRILDIKNIPLLGTVKKQDSNLNKLKL